METRLQEQRESLEETVRAPGRRREQPVESGHAVSLISRKRTAFFLHLSARCAGGAAAAHEEEGGSVTFSAKLLVEPYRRLLC
jgi:hypothetical protein